MNSCSCFAQKLANVLIFAHSSFLLSTAKRKMSFVPPPANWRARAAGTVPAPTAADLPPVKAEVPPPEGVPSVPQLQHMLQGVQAAFADTVADFTADGGAGFDQSGPTADMVLAERLEAMQRALHARAPAQARLQRLVELEAAVRRRRDVLASINRGIGRASDALAIADAAAADTAV